MIWVLCIYYLTPPYTHSRSLSLTHIQLLFSLPANTAFMSMSVILINLMNFHIFPSSFNCISCFFIQPNLMCPSNSPSHVVSPRCLLESPSLSGCSSSALPECPYASLAWPLSHSCSFCLLVFSPARSQDFEVSDHKLFNSVNTVSSTVSNRMWLH